MNEDNVLTYAELCRLCLTNPGIDDLFEKTDLVQDIYLCTGVKVFKSNNLPRKICAKCFEIVINAKNLRVMVNENETHMKIFYGIDLDKPQDLQMDKIVNEKEKFANSRDDMGAESSDDGTESEEKDNVSKASKRRRSSSSEDVHKSQSQKLFIRNDLFSNNMVIPGKEGTYTEGTKYGISKTRTTNESGDIKVTYTCALCPKTFSSWKKVYCHQRMHNKKIVCPRDKCGKKFATKGDLEKHIRTHTGERPYNCDMCSRSFAQRCSLKAHKESIHPQDSDSDRLVIDLKS